MAPRYALDHLVHRQTVGSYIPKEYDRVRVGVAVVLYSDLPLNQLAPPAADVLEAFLAFAPPGALDSRWASSVWGKLTPRSITLQMKEFRTAVTPKWEHIDLHYGQGEPPGSVGTHAFKFRGRLAGQNPLTPGMGSALGMEFPLEVFDRTSPADFVAFVARVAGLFPFTSGNAGLAFKFNGSLSGSEDRDFIHRHLPRYLAIDPGFDFSWAHRMMRGRSPSAHWLNLLGKDLIATLGGAQFRSSIRKEVEVHEIGEGLLLRASEFPPVGDKESGACDLVCVPDVSKLLRPLYADYGDPYKEWVPRYDALPSTDVAAWPRADLGKAAPAAEVQPKKASRSKGDPAQAKAAMARAKKLLDKEKFVDGFVWLNIAAHFGDKKAAVQAGSMEEQEVIGEEEIQQAARELARRFRKGQDVPKDEDAVQAWTDRAGPAR